MAKRFVYTIFIYKGKNEKVPSKVMVLHGKDKKVHGVVKELLDKLGKVRAKLTVRSGYAKKVGDKEFWSVDLGRYHVIVEKQPES